MKILMKAAAVLAMTAVPAFAAPPAALVDYVAENAPTWLSDPVVIGAIQAQNADHANLDQSAIDAMDQQWRSELDGASGDMVQTVMAKPVSQYLGSLVTDTQGRVREVFVMDEHGLNVGQSGVTSDFWQGDEAKFQETFPKGADAIHVSDIEFDESAQAYISQVSLPVIEPESGAVIGAVTFGIDAGQF